MLAPFNKTINEVKRESSGNVILLASDVHENWNGLDAVFERAAELKSQGKLNSIVLGGDLIRGVFDNREDLIKFQKVSERLRMLQNLKRGGAIFIESPFELVDRSNPDKLVLNENLLKHRLVGQTDDFKNDLRNAINDYIKLYQVGRSSLRAKLNEVRKRAIAKGVDDYIIAIPGNYEGSRALRDVFEQDGKQRVLGFGNTMRYEHQLDYDPGSENSFITKVINAGGTKFFGYGSSSSSTRGWIPSELSEHYGDLSEQEIMTIQTQALGAVLKELFNVLPSKSEDEKLKLGPRFKELERYKEMAEKGTLHPTDLQKVENVLLDMSKVDKTFQNENFLKLEEKFKERYDEIINNFQHDARFIRDKVKGAQAHIHLSHEPISLDVGYLDESSQAQNPGGVLAKKSIYESGNDSGSYKGYTVGLYGHVHRRRIDVMTKKNGKYFFAVSTKGMKYSQKDTDDSHGINTRPVSQYEKGEFAEIGLDKDKELEYVSFHETAGGSVVGHTKYSRDDILKNKVHENKEAVEAFDKLNYLYTDAYQKSRSNN